MMSIKLYQQDSDFSQFNYWFNTMNHKQKHTLEAILKKPASGNVHWRDVESLLVALGAKLQVTHGARMTFVLHGVAGTVHKPHHSSVLTKQDIRHLRDFLHNVGF